MYIVVNHQGRPLTTRRGETMNIVGNHHRWLMCATIAVTLLLVQRTARAQTVIHLAFESNGVRTNLYVPIDPALVMPGDDLSSVSSTKQRAHMIVHRSPYPTCGERIAAEFNDSMGRPDWAPAAYHDTANVVVGFGDSSDFDLEVCLERAEGPFTVTVFSAETDLPAVRSFLEGMIVATTTMPAGAVLYGATPVVTTPVVTTPVVTTPVTNPTPLVTNPTPTDGSGGSVITKQPVIKLRWSGVWAAQRQLRISVAAAHSEIDGRGVSGNNLDVDFVGEGSSGIGEGHLRAGTLGDDTASTAEDLRLEAWGGWALGRRPTGGSVGLPSSAAGSIWCAR